MPELPEVTTTVNGLNKVLPKLSITDIWSDYYNRTKYTQDKADATVGSPTFGRRGIKNRKYFEYFKKDVVGKKVLKAERRGKNVLIHLSGNRTMLIHKKMTGHLLYGKYRLVASSKQQVARWRSEEKYLSDPFNQFIHFVCTLSNGKHLAFSDMRKFAKVMLFETEKRDTVPDISLLGPEPLDHFTFAQFKERLLRRKSGKIKQVLMDQTVIAGIGNIYSDEILWAADIHPERRVSHISKSEMKMMYSAMKKILTLGISMGGDSMSDYRNIYGERGNFQNSHKAYRRTKEKCLKKGCHGSIRRIIVGSRSAHFCDAHQK